VRSAGVLVAVVLYVVAIMIIVAVVVVVVLVYEAGIVLRELDGSSLEHVGDDRVKEGKRDGRGGSAVALDACEDGLDVR
jgi:hypothetical protein